MKPCQKKKRTKKLMVLKYPGRFSPKLVVFEIGNFISSAYAKISWESMLGNTKVGNSSGCQGGVCKLLVNMYSSIHFKSEKIEFKI